MAEECLIEVVDAGVQAADILADLSPLLAESGEFSAHVLANGGDRTPEAQANPRNRSNATGLKVNRFLAES